jgi:phosphoenolpyruvate carboxylase
MWDWEGKFVDEAVIDRLFNRYAAYFKKEQLGRDKFLTFRIPNIWQERGIRLARSFMGIITAAHTAHDHHVHTPPLFEVILPMTTSATQLVTILEKFERAVKYEKEIFEEKVLGPKRLEMIPLIEGSATLLDSRPILKDYVKRHTVLYKRPPAYLRPFIARSDPALDAGFVAATLSARGAISEYYRFQEETGIPVYPILGVGSLPFRGGLSPRTLDRFFELYGGIRTVTLQSAFRYDFPQADVKKAIAELGWRLPRHAPVRFSDAELADLTRLSQLFAKYYRPVIQKLAPTINDLARYIPSHRERIPHTGHFGYSRKMGKNHIHLPRAITFVAVLSSLGAPPTLVGTGRGLKEVIKNGQEKILRRLFPDFEKDILWSGRYLNWENLKFLARRDATWGKIREDVLFLEEFLGERLEPKSTNHFLHRNLTSNIYHLWQKGNAIEPLKENILAAAKVRRSLG